MDLDQIDEVEIHPVYIASLAYFNLTADDFLDENTEELSEIVDYVEFQFNSENAENLERMDFTFKFSNSFSRNFIANVQFFDLDGAVVFTLEPAIEIEANTQGIETVITVEQPDITLIYSAYQAGFEMQLVPDAIQPITPDTDGVVNLQSSLTLYFKVGL